MTRRGGGTFAAGVLCALHSFIHCRRFGPVLQVTIKYPESNRTNGRQTHDGFYQHPYEAQYDDRNNQPDRRKNGKQGIGISLVQAWDGQN